MDDSRGTEHARRRPAEESTPLVTVAVPSLNQGQYLDDALTSIFEQPVPLEVFVSDGGSTDKTRQVIAKWENRLAGWRSRPDNGQAAAVNEGIASGRAPFVCWLNSDDWLLTDGLSRLVTALENNPRTPAAYGKVYNYSMSGIRPVRVTPFNVRSLAIYCIVSQPGTLIRRTAWEKATGLREDLHMAFDYDLWWRLYKAAGPMLYVDVPVAVNRAHPYAKTNRYRRLHYREAISVVKEHNGSVPLKWRLAQPYAVWFRSIQGWCHRKLNFMT